MHQDPFLCPTEYFTNNGNGYENPYTFSTATFDVKVYCNNELTSQCLKKFEKYLLEMLKKYSVKYIKDYEKFYNATFNRKKSLNFYLFKNKKKYKNIQSMENTQFRERNGYRWRVSEYTLADYITYFDREDHFTNSDKGYRNLHTFKLEDTDIEIKCYYNELTLEQVDIISKTIQALSKEFFEKIPGAKNPSGNLKFIDINIFILTGMLTRGCTKLSQEPCFQNKSEIFISDPSDQELLRHELAHVLIFYATNLGYKFIPRFLLEGIAMHFEEKFLSKLPMLTPEECDALTLKKLEELNLAEDNEEQEFLLYRVGYFIVNYLQDKHPGIISQYFADLREATLTTEVGEFPPSFTKFMNSLTSNYLDMKSENSTGLTEKIKNSILTDVENLPSSWTEATLRLLKNSTIISLKELDKFKSTIILYMKWDLMISKCNNQIKPIQSILSKQEDMKKWLLQPKEQLPINKKNDIHPAVIQQMAGHNDLDTSLGSPSIVDQPKGSEAVTEIVERERICTRMSSCNLF